jgi:hypothetical protein
LSALRTLESLESIEVARGLLCEKPDGSVVCSIPEFRSILIDRHPLLCRILVTGREITDGGRFVGTELWKRVASEWVHRKFHLFSYWEVLNGAYENICEWLRSGSGWPINMHTRSWDFGPWCRNSRKNLSDSKPFVPRPSLQYLTSAGRAMAIWQRLTFEPGM